MMTQMQTIACPNCQQPITFDVKMLLTGSQFQCSGCHSSIGLATESKTIVEKTMEKFEQLKNRKDDKI